MAMTTTGRMGTIMATGTAGADVVAELGDVTVDDGDSLEIVHFVGGGDQPGKVDEDSWTVAGRTFRSRLIVGTGKYKNFEQNAAAVAASGAEIG